MTARKMTELTERQRRILLAVIREFMREADAVGSVRIVTRYNIDASSATVRNEMVHLSRKGYLEKDYSSSGRIPTDLAFRLFVKEMMEEISLPSVEQVNTRLSIFNKRFQEDELVHQILKYLTDNTGYGALCQLDDNLRYSGISKLTKYEELRDIEILEGILSVLEDQKLISDVFEKSATDDVCVLIGEECGIDSLEKCSLVFAGFGYVGSKMGYLGVLGPRRMKYQKVIPVVRLVKNAVEESVRGW